MLKDREALAVCRIARPRAEAAKPARCSFPISAESPCYQPFPTKPSNLPPAIRRQLRGPSSPAVAGVLVATNEPPELIAADHGARSAKP
jgi:hypothetical protein